MYDFLLDTNLLVYANSPTSRFMTRAKTILGDVIEEKLLGCVSIQNIYELYAVITDPKRVEVPLKQNQAEKLLVNYIEAENLPKIFPKETNLFNLLTIIRKYKITRQEIFDAQLVATMMDNEVKAIYTADEKFFRKFDFLEVLNPFK